MSDYYREKKSGFFRGLLLGVLAGAGTLYLLNNTKEGEEIKKKIKKRGKGLLNDLAEVVDEFEKRGKDFRKKAQRTHADLEGRVKEKVSEVARGAKKELSKIKKLRHKGQKNSRLFMRQGKPLKTNSS